VTALPTRLLPDNHEIAGDRLCIGGCDTLELAAEFGTPLFVYDEAHLRSRCREAVAAFGPGVAYAAKAFFCVAMARLVHEEGMHIDVATGGELHVALQAGVPAERLVLHGNNKSLGELAYAIEAGVGRIVVDSFDELDRLDALHAEAGRPPGTAAGTAASTAAGTAAGTPGTAAGDTPASRAAVPAPRVLLRLTPGIKAETHDYVATGHDDTKFGFTVASGAAAAAIERASAAESVELVGVHAHIGSQVFAVDSFRKAAEVIAEAAAPWGLPELSVGGGLGVAYVSGEQAPSITEWGRVVRRACEQAGVTARLSAEPGRSIAAAAAVTLYTVGTIKELEGIRTYVAVDGGMSDNPRPVLYGSGYETFLPRAVTAERPKRITLVGKHCESGDVLVRDGMVPADISVGDVIATPVTGAYGHSMGSNYNKVLRPAVVFAADGEARLAVRRETYEDLIRLDL